MLRGDNRFTKWDLITDAEKTQLQATPCLDSEGKPLRCIVCDRELPTEADFAKHFVLTDTRFKNLGNCPRD